MTDETEDESLLGGVHSDSEDIATSASAAPRAPLASSPSLMNLLAGRDDRSRIIVAVRKRPKQPDEAQDLDLVEVQVPSSCVFLKESRLTVDLRKVTENRGAFQFDFAFDATCSNARVYAETTRPLLDVVRKGGNALVFAFGQTGSGKTHTMLGSADGREHGLYSLAMQDIVSNLRGMRLSVSFYEIYGGKVFDLLNERSKIKALEDEHKNLNLVGLTEHAVSDHSALLQLVAQGASVRAEGSTHANDRSSRSHAVLTLTIKTRREQKVFGKMTFIDLAGSERGRDTLDLDKKTRAEGAEINRSLLALKECVRALDQRKNHIPFRGSKLTMVLRDCFLGNCLTVMIANISPAARHIEDTINTLKYTDRIKELRPLEREAQLHCPKEPTVCEKCSFPIFLEDPSLHICPKKYEKCKFCRTEMVKDKLEAHLLECNEAPMSCPECGGRIRRGELINHQSKCLRGNVACQLCNQLVDRTKMQLHLSTECQSVKVNCPHCRIYFFRSELNHHVARCPMRQTTCAACGFLVRQANMKQHQRVCIAVRKNERMAFMSHETGAARSFEPTAVAEPTYSEHEPVRQLQPRALQSKPSLGHLKVPVPNTPTRLPPLTGRTANPLQDDHVAPEGSGGALTARVGSRGEKPRTPASRTSSALETPKKRSARKRTKQSAKAEDDVPSVANPHHKAAAHARPTASAKPMLAHTEPQVASIQILEERTTTTNGRRTMQRPPPLAIPRRDSTALSSDFAASAESGRRVITPKHQLILKKKHHEAKPVVQEAFSGSYEQETSSSAEVSRQPSTVRGNESVMSPMTMWTCEHCDRDLPDRARAVHLETECLRMPVPCPFASSGCRASPQRGQLATHLQEAISEHLYLVQAATVSVREENMRLHEKVMELEANQQRNSPGKVADSPPQLSTTARGATPSKPLFGTPSSTTLNNNKRSGMGSARPHPQRKL